MGILVSCLASSVASCCIGATCSCCGRAVSVSKSSATRWVYVVLFLLVSFVAYLFSHWAYVWLEKLPLKILADCPANSTCYGALAVYRITFGLAVFHLIQALLFIGVKDTSDGRAQFQDGWFPLKLIFLVGITVAAFFIPNSFFIYYGWVSVFGAGFFVVIQLILLIEFAYSWNESWVRNMEDEMDTGDGQGSKWYYGLLGSTLFMLAASIVLIAVMYKYFCHSGCELNTFFVTTALLINTILCLVCLHPKVREARPSSGLLQSSVITLYTTYLVWSAIQSEPASDCSPFNQSTSSLNASIIIGAIFTIVSVCYSTFNASGSSVQLGIGEKLEQQPLSSDYKDAEGNVIDDEAENVKYSYSFFHISFCLGALYICMLLTNWMTLSHSDDDINVDRGMVSVWVKITSGWVIQILYLWTLVAPIFCADRSFE